MQKIVNVVIFKVNFLRNYHLIIENSSVAPKMKNAGRNLYSPILLPGHFSMILESIYIFKKL